MKSRSFVLIVIALVVAALFSSGVKYYWHLQDARAAEYLNQALRKSYLQPRQGIVTTQILTANGWLISRARMTYEGPEQWQVEYFSPGPDRTFLGRQSGRLWRWGMPVAPGKIGNNHATTPVAVQTPPAQIPGTLLQSLASYTTKYLGTARLIGRPVRIIGLADKETANLIKVFWVDEKTGVFLRQDSLSQDGKPLSSTEFQNIEFAPSQPLELPIPEQMRPGARKSLSTLAPLPEISRRVGFPVLTPKYLPAGFRLEQSYLFPCPCGCNDVSADLHFTDGVKSFSVFETSVRDPHCSIAKDLKTMAGKGVFTGASPTIQLVAVRRGKVLIMVVGEMPARQLKEIADSF
jgi:negative regulator of sigma E activity